MAIGAQPKDKKMELFVELLCTGLLWALKKQEVIDHKDRNPSNNHKSNLRFCTAQENSRNVSLSSRNSSGFLGVYWKEKKKHWEASIKIDGKDKYLGSFKNKDDAIKARLLGEKEYYGEFAPQRNLFEQYGIV